MTRTLTRAIPYLQVAIIATLFLTSFLVKPQFFNWLITSKHWGLEQVMISVVVFLAIYFPFIKSISLSATDGAVLIFACWFIFNETIVHDSPFRTFEHTSFHIILWLVVYLFVRVASSSKVFEWGLAVVWMAITLAQSVLGLMQLYGFEWSYHGLFNITGTFHNPGPFSGFVVSGLPLALGIICYTEFKGENTETKRSEVPPKRKNTEYHRGIFLKWFKINVSFISIFRYSILALAWLTLVAILLVLPPAQSRAAWIAGIAGSIFVLAGHPALLSFKNNLKQKFLTIKKPLRVLLLIVVFLSIATAGFGLYSMKKGSADGRMLIWQVTGQLIKQSPVTGHGTGAFNALYMNEQANWFASDKGSEAQAMVAGTPEGPFNEPLKLWLEKGLIGIILAGAILYLIFVNNSKAVNHKPKTQNYQTFPILGTSLRYATINPYPALRDCATLRLQTLEPSTLNPKLSTSFKGTLISLLVFSLFSYPFDISSLTLQLVILVAILSATSKTVLLFKGKGSLLLSLSASIVLILTTIHFVPQRQAHYQAMKIWKKADQLYSFGSYHTAVEVYEEAFPVLENEGLFLQMYGKALNMNEEYQKSNQILEMAQSRFSNQIIQNAMGDNYKVLGNFPAAEAAYEKSKHMIPSLLLPKYLMAKLYNESGQNQKAQQAAEEILNYPVKVESSATREIMREMKKIINDQ